MRSRLRRCCSVETVKSSFPITHWLPRYSFRDLQCDVISGLTVALTVIPQGLAYAKIANLPPQHGLYSAFMGCFVYMFLGTSKDITLGPTAIMSLMTAAFATSPVDDDVTYAVLLTLACGVVQLLMGICRLGIIVSFFSYPVINAFTSAAAITIALGQVKGILGLNIIPVEFIDMVYETCKNIPDTNVWDLTMGVSSLVVLLLLKQLRGIRWKENACGRPPTLPQQIGRKLVWLLGIGANAVVVVVTSVVVAVVISQGHGGKLSITGEIKSGLPPFKVPSFTLQHGNETISFGGILKDIGSGLGVVPLIALVETIAIGKAFARQNNYRIQPNQELLAIGAANIVSSFVSSYPVTGSFSRTAVNSQSGVRTPAAGLFTGATVLLALQLLTPLFFYIPKAALSAVIISAVIQMVDFKVVPRLWRTQRWDLLPLFATFFSCLALGIEYGILVGVGVSIVMLLYPMARPSVQVHHADHVIITADQGLRFPSVEYVQNKILKAMESGDTKPHSVILDCSNLSAIDSTTIQVMTELVADFRRKDVAFVLACVKKHIASEFHAAEIPQLMLAPTVEKARALIEEQKSEDTLTVTIVDQTPEEALSATMESCSQPVDSGSVFLDERL